MTIKCPHCRGTGKIEADKATIGDMILCIRDKKSMTQADLAGKVGLSRAQIANIEAGRSDITIRGLAKFAAAFGCAMKDLVP